ncbi:MAG: hypothetical protein MHPSP_004800, partial [Paramarteilia canceri]
SKHPVYGYMLSKCKNINLHIVHIVRNPYDVAYSWSVRDKKKPHQEKMSRHSLVKSCLYWVIWNFLIERVAKKAKNITSYTLIKYEDFSDSPLTYLDKIRRAVENPQPVPASMKNKEKIDFSKKSHSFSGNPNRFDRKIKIQTRSNKFKISFLGKLV